MENNKEMIKEEILSVIERAYKEHKLPPMSISDEEIDDLMYVVESNFLVHNKMNEYRNAMNIIIRKALYYATVDNRDAFIINHLAMALNDLSAFSIPSDEIKAMQEELFTRCSKHIK